MWGLRDAGSAERRHLGEGRLPSHVGTAGRQRPQDAGGLIVPNPGKAPWNALRQHPCGRRSARGRCEAGLPNRKPGRLAIRAWDVYNYLQGYTSMRTNIVIDDKLMQDTLRATGLKTKRAAVEEALRTLLRLRRQAGIRRLRGKLDWQGDQNAMRSDR